MNKICFILLTLIIGYNSCYSQLSISSTPNGIVSIAYGGSGDYSLYDPLLEPTIYVYVWVPEEMNSLTQLYRDQWFDSLSLTTITWNETESKFSGTMDLNLHDFIDTGGIIPTATTVLDFQLILRDQTGDVDRQSDDLLASNYGFSNATLPVEEFSKNPITLNLIKNNLEIKGLEFNQKFQLNIYDINGRLHKKLNEKSSLNLDDLSPSIYVLKLKTENNIIINKKIIKV